MNDETASFLRHCKVVLGLSKATLEAYENDLTQFFDEIKKKVSQIDADDIYSFLANFANFNTYNRKLSAINGFLDYLYDSLLTDKNFKLIGAKTPKTLPKYLPPETIFRSLETIDRTKWIGKRDYALIMFLYASGARISEALKAEIKDLEGGWVKIRHAKGAKERLVPIAKKALTALEEYLQERESPSPLFFINYRGKALSRVFAFKITERILGVSPHALRHSFASALIMGGADLRVVQELLGHASLNTTQIYTHLERRHLYESVIDCHPLSGETP